MKIIGMAGGARSGIDHRQRERLVEFLGDAVAALARAGAEVGASGR